MSLRGLSLLSLKGNGNWERFLKTGREQISLLSSRKVKRRIGGITGQSASHPSLGK